MTNFMVMKYAVLILIVAPVCMSGKCWSYNRFRINGTQTPNTTICPKLCNCYYCQYTNNQKGPVTTTWIDKNVYCRQKAFKRIPEDIPVDVHYLDLYKNSISKLSSDEMTNYKELEYLDLSFNDLQDSNIGDHFFDCLPKLRNLNLDNNHAITHIPIVWFQKLVALKYLYIRYSAVKTLQRGVFKNCSNLTRIHLRGNKLVSLPPDLFRNQPVLRSIDVSHNSINAFQDEIFRGSPEISYFFLHDNKIITISQNMGLQNLTKLIQIGFSQNPFVCDCNLVWFRHWINQTNAILTELDKAECRNTNGTSLVNFDADSLICIEHDFTKPVLIATFCSAAFLTVLGTFLYVFRWDIRYWNQRRLLRKQYEKLQNEGPPPIDGVQVRYDAFISYNSKDVDWVLKSALPTLEGPEFKFRLCVDFRDFVVGGAIADNISDAIKYSRKMLIVVTKNFAKSEWCYFEMEMARTRMFDNHEDILVVVILEHVASRNMPTLLQKILRKKTYIEWTENPEGQKVFWTRLAAALNTPNAHHDRLLN